MPACTVPGRGAARASPPLHAGAHAYALPGGAVARAFRLARRRDRGGECSHPCARRCASPTRAATGGPARDPVDTRGVLGLALAALRPPLPARREPSPQVSLTLQDV